MNYRQEYEKWLASPALSEDERNELKAIANDEKEIENRFYGPLEFGTAGLRGTMYVGLHNMTRHVIRWATQGFANVIRAEGEEAMKKGVAICMDCRNHSMDFARAAAEVDGDDGDRTDREDDRNGEQDICEGDGQIDGGHGKFSDALGNEQSVDDGVE